MNSTGDSLSPDEVWRRFNELAESVPSDQDGIRRHVADLQAFLSTPGVRELLDAENDAGFGRSLPEPDRVRDARRLLSHAEFVRVESIEDEGIGLTFNDLAAVAFDDLVARSVAVAKEYPGVTDARHEDRELIMLSGDFDRSGLEQYVREWWLVELRREAG